MRPSIFASAVTAALLHAAVVHAAPDDATPPSSQPIIQPTISTNDWSLGSAQVDKPAHPASPYFRSDVLMFTALGFSAAHHVDNFLSDPHPNFPLGTLPLTASLLVYPMFLTGYFADLGPNYFLIADLVGLGGLIPTILIPGSNDTLPRRYSKWSDGNNNLGVSSPAIGAVGTSVTLGLVTSVSAHLVSNLYDGFHYGFTWKRLTARELSPKAPQLGVVTTPGGAIVSGSMAW